MIFIEHAGKVSGTLPHWLTLNFPPLRQLDDAAEVLQAATARLPHAARQGWQAATSVFLPPAVDVAEAKLAAGFSSVAVAGQCYLTAAVLHLSRAGRQL